MKKLQQNFTTIAQSNRLLELGLPADSADCIYGNEDDDYIYVLYNNKSFSKIQSLMRDIIPCWSVGRLIEIICNCHIVTNQLMENWICCDKNTNLIELLIRDIEVFTNTQHMDFSKLDD